MGGKALVNLPVKPTKHPLKKIRKSPFESEDFGQVQRFNGQKQIDVCHCGREYFLTQACWFEYPLLCYPGLGESQSDAPSTPRNHHHHLVFEQSHVLGGPQQKLWRQWISCNHRQAEGCAELHPASALHIKNFTA